MKISAITSNNISSFSYQMNAYLVKWPLLKSPDKYSHALQFTKNVSPLNLEAETIPQIKK